MDTFYCSDIICALLGLRANKLYSINQISGQDERVMTNAYLSPFIDTEDAVGVIAVFANTM